MKVFTSLYSNNIKCTIFKLIFHFNYETKEKYHNNAYNKVCKKKPFQDLSISK